MSLESLGAPNPKGGVQFDTQLLRQHFTRVVIQETPSGRYWESSALWTTEIDKAASFQTCSAALEQATHLKLQNVQLVLTREIKESEIIPLKTSFRS